MCGVKFSCALIVPYQDQNSAIAFVYYDEDDNYNEYHLDTGKLGLCELKTIAENHMKSIINLEDLKQFGYTKLEL
jgi:hypothetical protein